MTDAPKIVLLTPAQGPAGPVGATPVLSIGNVTALPSGSTPSVNLRGTSAAPILDLAIPAGAKGETGAVSTVPGPPGAIGATPSISIGNVTTLAAGTAATVNLRGTNAAPVLDLALPQGSPGIAGTTPTFTIGNVTTLTAGTAATATLRGTSAAPILDLGLPQGGAYSGPLLADKDGFTVRHSETYPAIPGPDNRPPTHQLSQTGNDASLLGLFQFGDTQKGIYLPIVRSRGDGKPYLSDGATPNPGYYKASQPSDRLVNIAFYGSQAANAAHAGYLQVIAAENCVNNECASIITMYTANSRTNGNGWTINPWAQMIVPGPNMIAPAAYDTSTSGPTKYGANFRIGPGAAAAGGAPFKIDPGPLLTVAEANAVEVDASGAYWITNTAASRRSVMVAYPATISGLTVGATGGTGSYVKGDNWAVVTLTMGATGYTTGPQETVARFSFSPLLPASPCAVVSMDSASSSFFSVCVKVAMNQISVQTTASTALAAGGTYVFHIMWRVP